MNADLNPDLIRVHLWLKDFELTLSGRLLSVLQSFADKVLLRG